LGRKKFVEIIQKNGVWNTPTLLSYESAQRIRLQINYYQKLIVLQNLLSKFLTFRRREGNLIKPASQFYCDINKLCRFSNY